MAFFGVTPFANLIGALTALLIGLVLPKHFKRLADRHTRIGNATKEGASLNAVWTALELRNSLDALQSIFEWQCGNLIGWKIIDPAAGRETLDRNEPPFRLIAVAIKQQLPAGFEHFRCGGCLYAGFGSRVSVKALPNHPTWFDTREPLRNFLAEVISAVA